MSDESKKTFNRDTRGDDTRGRSDKSNEKGNEKGNEKDKLQNVYKKAKKFKQLVYDKYSHLNLPFSEMLRKAKKYARKYQISDDDFDMFKMFAFTDKQSPYALMLPQTPMSKALGYDVSLTPSSKMNVKPEDIATVREIVDVMYPTTRPLHSQIVMQSLQYRDCAPEAITGKFNPEKHNNFAYIHPIVAALFLPKVQYLDEQILLSNIGYLVKSKYEGTQIMSKPDYDLYWAMISDPNDGACNVENAVKDLKYRYDLQIKMWEDVLCLRQGKYYTDMASVIKFSQTLDKCRLNIYDAPDLAYVKDEGTILRRILSAFSIRPTLISTNRLYSSPIGMQYGFNSAIPELPGLANAGNVTQVPMIVLRLPPNTQGMGVTTGGAITLASALNQPEWFIENKILVPKSRQLIHSRDVLFFYVNRRYQTTNIAYLGAPCTFNAFPMTISGWEKLNDSTVNADQILTIQNEDYVLRSIVTVDTIDQQGQKVITGSSTMIYIPIDYDTGITQDTRILYDPASVSRKLLTATGEYERNDPIQWIPKEAAIYGNQDSWGLRSRTRGTIYMYVKKPAIHPC